MTAKIRAASVSRTAAAASELGVKITGRDCASGKAVLERTRETRSGIRISLAPDTSLRKRRSLRRVGTVVLLATMARESVEAAALMWFEHK